MLITNQAIEAALISRWKPGMQPWLPDSGKTYSPKSRGPAIQISYYVHALLRTHCKQRGLTQESVLNAALHCWLMDPTEGGIPSWMTRVSLRKGVAVTVTAHPAIAEAFRKKCKELGVNNRRMATEIINEWLSR